MCTLVWLGIVESKVVFSDLSPNLDVESRNGILHQFSRPFGHHNSELDETATFWMSMLTLEPILVLSFIHGFIASGIIASMAIRKAWKEKRKKKKEKRKHWCCLLGLKMLASTFKS